MFEDAILFCGRDKAQYPFLSNFFKCKITDSEGKVWPSSEHLYQAEKFVEPVFREAIRVADSPKNAKIVANNYLRHLIREDWHKIKVDRMTVVVWMKFEQNPKLREKLLATGDKLLIEHRAADSFWGSGPDFKGENHLGKILMRVRDKLKTLDVV